VTPRCKCDRIELVAMGGARRWIHETACPAYVEPPEPTADELFLANAGWIQRAGGWFYPDLDSGSAIELGEALRIEREWQNHLADQSERPLMNWRPIRNALAITAVVVAVLFIGFLAASAVAAPRAGAGPHPIATAELATIASRPVTPAGGGRTPCATVVQCRHALVWARKDRAHLHALLLHRDRENLHRAIAIASALFGVRESAMTCIARAESGYGAQTTPEPTSGALGPFQWLSTSWQTTPLGQAGYDRRDALAASLTTAQRVVQDGGWREWVTGPGCGL
jgi:hypothetical protein